MEGLNIVPRMIVEKAESLENFSKIPFAVWKNETKDRNRFKVI